MPIDMTNIPMKNVQVCTSASFGAQSLRPVSAGTSQYEMPKNESATGPPTVTWKWPTIHIVLWMVVSMAYEALTMPPAPPRMNSSMPRAEPANAGLLHGSERTTPMTPDWPLRCAAISKDAKIANAVKIDGMTTP